MPVIWQLYCCLTSLCVYRQINSYQPPSGYLSITRSASGGSARDLRRQQAQGVPGVGKKADAVADRSGVPLLYNHACLHQGSPLPEGKAFRLSRLSSIRRRHLAGRVPRAKRLGRRRRNPGSRNLHKALIYLLSEKLVSGTVFRLVGRMTSLWKRS